MLSFLYDSGWLGQLLAPTDVTPEDELYDACFLGDAERAQVLLERGETDERPGPQLRAP